MARLGLKLWENAFRTIPDISFLDAEIFGELKKIDVEKLNVGNRLKRVFPKFEPDRSHPRGVNGRSKFRQNFFWSKNEMSGIV